MGKRKVDSELHRIKLETGTVYQTQKGGTYYFRYQVRRERKCVSLKTANQEEAIRKAKELLPTVRATNLEIIATHVKVARKLAAKRQSLPLDRVWEFYSSHPEKATPATMHEELSYLATFNEFRGFIDPRIKEVADITQEHAIKFAEHLKASGISVSTHNRKLIRLRRIFSTLDKFREGENPFSLRSLRRKNREEQDVSVRRIAFTREEEERLREVLDDPRYKILHKEEIKVIFHIGMYTGQRLKDCVLMRWQNVDLDNRRVWVKQFKTGKEVSIPLAEPLRQLLVQTKEKQVKDSVYISPEVAERYKKKDARGKVIGDNYVNIDVMRVIRWIGVETKVAVPGRARKVTVRGFHSLRHSFASFAAEAGVPRAVVESILGADSSILDRFYVHVGEDAQRAAIEAISGSANDAPAVRIRRALDYIASIPEPSAELLAVEKILRD